MFGYVDITKILILRKVSPEATTDRNGPMRPVQMAKQGAMEFRYLKRRKENGIIMIIILIILNIITLLLLVLP